MKAFKPGTPWEPGTQLATEPWSGWENFSSADLFQILSYIDAGQLPGQVGFGRGAGRKGTAQPGIQAPSTTHHPPVFARRPQKTTVKCGRTKGCSPGWVSASCSAPPSFTPICLHGLHSLFHRAPQGGPEHPTNSGRNFLKSRKLAD